jgi:hypothetical protein
MLPELEYFIDTYIVEDSKKDILESFDILDDLEIEYNDTFISILLTEGDVENAQLVDNFKNTLEKMIADALKLHGIVLTEEASLEFKNKIMHAIINISFYEGKDDLAAILDSSEETNYKFAELIEEVTELNLMDVFNKIETINPDIFKRLSEIFNRKLIHINEDELEKEAFKNKIITKLKNIKILTKYDKALGFTLVNSNIVLGSDFGQYATYADKHFEYLNNDEIAIEVLILLTMSNEGFDKPLITFRKYSQDLFSDLDKITKIDIKLNNLVIAYDKFIIENIGKVNA